jgi:ubiquinone/menaquinone biosynthesis C-methylase UbiE
MGQLYSREEARFLAKMERAWKLHDREKINVILQHLGRVDSLLDIGCGSGQILKGLSKRVPELVGVDENEERLKDASKNCPDARLIRAKAEELKFYEEFDAVLTSMVLHEVKQFGTRGQMGRVLKVIWNALKPGGRYFLLDHLDPGDGKVVIKASGQTEELLREFKAKFRCRCVYLKELGPGIYEIEKRDLQDFVTKTWSFNSPMEDMEMNETHAPFRRKELEAILRRAGFSPKRFIPLTDIENDLKDHRIELKGKTSPWHRKFLLISSKPE